MKRILTAAIVALGMATGIATPALAADMAVKAPPRPVVAPFTWQGLYVGGSIGGRWADVDWTTTNFGIAAAGAVPPALVPQGTAGYDSSTFRVGGYVGFNYMISPTWLIGLEGDFAWGDGDKTLARIPGVTPAGVTTDRTSVGHGWDASIRARVGVLVSPDWLLYATGGWQWLDVDATLACSVGSCPVINFGAFSIGPFNGADSTTMNGWTVGLGLEGRLWGNWIGRVEYRYADLGDWTARFAGNNIGVIANIEVQTHTAYVGLGYKF
jgi:outer membrane immunogenic protein